MSDAARSPVQRVLMVCMGNICRSPTAEGVLRHKLQAAGLAAVVEVDSAGTHADWHAGEPPDPRAIRHAERRGYDLRKLRARKVRADDFERFDLIVGMDDDNLFLLEEMAPAAQRGKVVRLMDYRLRQSDREVPDPYKGTAADFERVLDLVEDACEGLVQSLRERPLR